MSEVIPVPNCIKVPFEAYRYWPKDAIIYTGQGKKIQRNIFARVEFTEIEKRKLKKLEEEIQKGALGQIRLPQNWTTSETVRYLHGTGWKTRRALKALKDHLEYVASVITPDYTVLYPKVFKLLNSGCLYIHGRDYRYRPLFVLNLPALNSREASPDDFSQLIVFVMEYIIHNMFLPGQIENWCVLTDMHNHGLNMPINDMRKIVGTLQNNYRGRLACCYVVNAPKSFSFLWKMCRPFIDNVTVEKIDITRSPHSDKMMTHFNPDQVEERYGGTAKNVTQFWPPYVPNTPFHRNEAVKNSFLSDNSSYFEYHPEVSIIKEEDLTMIEESRVLAPSPKQVDLIFSQQNSFNGSIKDSESEKPKKKHKKSSNKHKHKHKKNVDFEIEELYLSRTASLSEINLRGEEGRFHSEAAALDNYFQDPSGISAINDSFHDSFYEKPKKSKKHKLSKTPDILEFKEVYIEEKPVPQPIPQLTIETSSTNCGCWSGSEATRTCLIF